ncbi:N-methyl-L-tryptophan oxidase [uncultured Jatrophihabitans sp.]|uniref:N-methyl-L-tryptophan oxidase n=1 Tax=uncultured Jatrophihabitans sp. TaxID=1610747 RepID=UPI0035CC7F07
MNRDFPVIVIGCGGLGSAACYWLAQEAGSAVLGLEQFPRGHSRGASQDHSRIIRLAQHQDAYADLAPDAYDAWHAVERASGVQLLTRTGGLVIEDVAERATAETGTRNITGYDDVMRRHDVEFERLDADEIVRRWPQFRLNGSEQGIYQAESGLVDAGKANATHVALARAAGATIRDETPVLHVRPHGQYVEVVTADETYLAERVIVTADAWTNVVLADLGIQLPLTVTQEQVTYYATPHLLEFAPERFPVFMWHGRHNFYGFPVYGEVATKLGQHNGGFRTTADTRTFEPDPVREQRQLDFLAEHLPRFAGPTLYTKTCLYTLPPDQHFVLDTLPEHPNVAVAVGAGHAFKFASLLGQVLADLSLRGKTGHPIADFRLDRPALTDPAFVPAVHV